MKKRFLWIPVGIASAVLAIALAGKKEKLPALDETLKTTLQTYLNYTAWCHPNEMAQTETAYSYEAYKIPEEQKYPETYVKIKSGETETWYCCTYTRQESYYITPFEKELPEGMEKIASGEIDLPEITKPVFGETTWKTANLDFTKKIVENLCARAFDEEYWAGESFEVYMSDFLPENGIMPDMYILCNDEVCELHGGLGHGSDWMSADMQLDFGPLNAEGMFDTIPKSEMDETKFDRICEIAVLHLNIQK